MKRRGTAEEWRQKYLDMIRPEMKRLSRELHNGIYAPSQAEFVLFSEITISREALGRNIGSWPVLVAALGMRMADRGYYIRLSNQRSSTLDDECPPLPPSEKKQAMLEPLGLIAFRSKRVEWQDRAGRTYSEMRHELR